MRNYFKTRQKVKKNLFPQFDLISVNSISCLCKDVAFPLVKQNEDPSRCQSAAGALSSMQLSFSQLQPLPCECPSILEGNETDPEGLF